MYTFMFDSQDLHFGDWYGRDIERLIWKCDVLQTVQEPIVIYQGDLLLSGCAGMRTDVLERELFPGIRKAKKAKYLIQYGTIFLWSVAHLPGEKAARLDEMLASETGYLGCVKVDLENRLQKANFLGSLICTYIVCDRSVWRCVDWFCEDDFSGELDFLLGQGFTKAELKRG